MDPTTVQRRSRTLRSQPTGLPPGLQQHKQKASSEPPLSWHTFRNTAGTRLSNKNQLIGAGWTVGRTWPRVHGKRPATMGGYIIIDGCCHDCLFSSRLNQPATCRLGYKRTFLAVGCPAFQRIPHATDFKNIGFCSRSTSIKCFQALIVICRGYYHLGQTPVVCECTNAMTHTAIAHAKVRKASRYCLYVRPGSSASLAIRVTSRKSACRSSVSSSSIPRPQTQGRSNRRLRFQMAFGSGPAQQIRPIHPAGSQHPSPAGRRR